MIDVRDMNSSPNHIFSLCHGGSVIHPSFPMSKVTLLLTINIRNSEEVFVLEIIINEKRRREDKREKTYPSSGNAIDVWERGLVSLKEEIVDDRITEVSSSSTRWGKN